MKTVDKTSDPMSRILSRLDGVCMKDQEREIAKAYLRKTDAALDLIWFAGAWIRAAGRWGMSLKAGARPGSRKPVTVHQR